MGITEFSSLFSLDSFVAGALLSSLRSLNRDRLQVAAAFGLCDGLASSLSAIPYSSVLAAPLVAACIVLISRPHCRLEYGRRWLLALPLGLSIDNLLDPVPLTTAIVCGVGSACSALFGLHLTGLWEPSHRPTARS